METETRQERILGRFSFRRGRKNPQYISIIAYAANSNETGGKPYITRYTNGKEFKPLTRERIEIERLIPEIGTADARDLRGVDRQRVIAQTHTAKDKA